MAETESAWVRLHATVLMPDHVHVIASPEERDIVSWVGAFKSLSTRAAWAAGHQGVVWQRRFYDRGLRGEEEFRVAVEYLLRNPRDARLIGADQDWPHTWLRSEISLGA